VKTTIEIPDELLRMAKATAAKEGRSLKEVLTVALRNHLRHTKRPAPGKESWRVVFGKGRPAEIQEVERIVSEDLERIEPETWT
jgi:hypothetical protein